MNAVERLHLLCKLLRGPRWRSFADLQEQTGASRSTLKRDLDLLRHRYHAPLRYSRLEGGYRIDADAQTNRYWELPGLWFSAAEIHALLTLQHMLANLDAASVLTPHLAPLTKRLNDLLGTGASQATGANVELRRRVRIIGLGQRSMDPHRFAQIGLALVQRQRLQIRYTARQNGVTTEREVSPLRLIHYRGNWHLDAWCHLRNELRNFSVDAVQSAVVLDQAAVHIEDDKLDARFGPSYGIFSGGAVRWAHLRFTAHRARWVADEHWHPQQQGAYLPDGRYDLHVPYADARELAMDILRYGADCEVVGPSDLRGQIATEVQKMRNIYL